MDDHQPVTCSQVYSLWQHNQVFRNFFIETLKSAPYHSFRWETPPITAETAAQGFEFVILESRFLSQSANPTAFQEHFRGCPRSDVIEFPNLGKDAVMVVPTPGEEPDVYAHLGSFIRGAPEGQVHALWIAVGKAMEEHLGEYRIWLNTAGGGVSWLHVRLDTRPKYYVYRPYRELD